MAIVFGGDWTTGDCTDGEKSAGEFTDGDVTKPGPGRLDAAPGADAGVASALVLGTRLSGVTPPPAVVDGVEPPPTTLPGVQAPPTGGLHTTPMGGAVPVKPPACGAAPVTLAGCAACGKADGCSWLLSTNMAVCGPLGTVFGAMTE